jgi:ERCC4-type nuclease
VIYVDNREKPTIIENGKKVFPDLIVKQLKIGDVESEEIVIERKEVADFLSSISDGRLQKQALQMQPFPHRYIIIEGDFDQLRSKSRRYRRYSNKTIFGMIASLEMKYNVSVLRVNNNQQFWLLVNRLLYKKDDTKVVEYSKTYKPKIKAENKKDVYLSMICCIPGISEGKGKLITDNFKLKELFTLEIDDLIKVKGIGKGLASKIKEVFK